MVNLLQMPTIRTRNLLLDLAPLDQGFDAIRQENARQQQRQDVNAERERQNAFRESQAAQSQANADRSYGLQQQQLQQTQNYQNKRLELQQNKYSDEQAQQRLTAAGRMFSHLKTVQDPAQRESMFKRVLAADPDLARNVANMPMDQAIDLVITKAGRGGTSALEQAKIDKLRAETAKLQGTAQKDSDQSRNIASGIDQLATIPQFAGDSFTSAVGPWQGDPDGGMVSSVARGAGSLWNTFGDRSTYEIRDRIAGDTEALAAAIKPLIRKPGEGPWTDADQRRLVAVVGDLAKATDEADYRRRLEGIRQRVRANFGIDLPEINWPGGEQQGGSQQTLPPGYSIRRID